MPDVKTILIVDDDDAFLYLTSVFMRKLYPAIEVLTARNGEEAFEKLEEAHPDIVFLDINMPVMNGWEFLTRLEEEGLHYSIFMMSSSIDPVDKRRSREHSLVTDFIEKPLNPDRLRSIVEGQLLQS